MPDSSGLIPQGPKILTDTKGESSTTAENNSSPGDDEEALPLIGEQDLTMRVEVEEHDPTVPGGGAGGGGGKRKSRVVLWVLLPVIALTLMGISISSIEDNPTEQISQKPIFFDVNAPPGSEERVFSRKQVSRRRRHSKSLELKQNTSALAFPVIEADEEIPLGKSALAEHAADVLECRDSVINFVINATDAKDECKGLKKAFDKTCNSDSVHEINAKAASADAPSAQAGSSTDTLKRRLLFKNKTKRNRRREWKLSLYQFARALRRCISKYVQPYHTIFFPEDEIAGTAWDEAMFQVENDYDFVIHEHTRRMLLPDSAVLRQLQAVTTTTMKLEEEEETELLQTNATLPPKVVEKKPAKPLQSLSLPTDNLHVSDNMLSETLMLSKDKDIEAAIKLAANNTNATLNEAQSDAVASSKAVHDTNAAVSALLNDPTSVEARTCCASILNVYHEHCDTTDGNDLSDSTLFIIVFVIAFCGVVKSLIRHFQLRWLPEAAGCILVGVAFGSIVSFIPHHDLSFDGDYFLRIMVPPIVFEAALSIDKRSFYRLIVPIMIYAVIGTLLASGITALIVHKGTHMLGKYCETVPYVESLTFGALISSIDPIAVLSVLSNMGMSDTDTIYVVIFGESLLNDGVAMVLFETLVHFLDDSLIMNGDALVDATIHFLVVALGSVFVGFVSGMACTCYYHVMKGCQTPLVEVLMFFCWALVPYYICDGIEWSGIVSIVTTGIIMDLYVVGQCNDEEGATALFADDAPIVDSVSQRRWERNTLARRILSKKGHLSSIARTHVGFVTEILATIMETAIFAYLGYFLFSSRYHWNFWHVAMALVACCVSRAIMIPLLSFLANWITSMQLARNNCRADVHQLRRGGWSNLNGVIIDSRMQTVLWFAGLRGAMSFALVENIPLYDAVTGEGSRMKAELKAMTSACIIFSVFVLGGCTDYMIERLGLAPAAKPDSSVELAPLIVRNKSDDEQEHSQQRQKNESPNKPTFRRQRGSRT